MVSLEMRFLTGLGLTNLAMLAGQRALEICLFLPLED